MHERPQAALFAALRELGYRVDSANDKLPAVIFGGAAERSQESGVRSQELGVRSQKSEARSQEKAGRRCRVSVGESSQFASALLLCARHGAWEIEITGANEDEMPYVTMTRELVKVFPRRGGEFQVEPDASGGSYFWAADWLCGIPRIQLDEVESSFFVPTACRAERLCAIRIRHWPESRWQIDARFPLYLPLPRQISRATDLGDSIMTAICLAADENTTRQWRWDGPERKQLESEPEDTPPVRFTELGRLRVQECERVVALRTELTKCGARVVEEGDTLTVFPSELHGAEIETYNDHRMAMCFAVLSLKVPGIKIKNPACVKKTFPNFFQKLAARPPHGLGAEIRDALTGRRLTHDELFAD
jgi:3-phosphoshikimate 1-carboxyvinyltransferase